MRKGAFKPQPKKKTKSSKPNNIQNSDQASKSPEQEQKSNVNKGKGKAKEAEPDKPRILLVAMIVGDAVDDCYIPFYNKIFAKASIQRAKSPKAVSRYLKEHTPQAIILVDHALAHSKEYASAARRIMRYVHEGGTLICANTFVVDLKRYLNKKHPTLPLFRLAGVPWQYGDTYRTYVSVNKDAVHEKIQEVMPKEIISEGILLDKVPNNQAWYLPTNESIADALMYDGKKPQMGWTPYAFARVGNGFFGYVGDMNVDGACDDLILAMAGLSVGAGYWTVWKEAENALKSGKKVETVLCPDGEGIGMESAKIPATRVEF
jgi:hypothetical protein